MGNIIQLPEDIVSKIAAGEVVERPASVVKELIENAFDAAATHVEVFVKDGGKTLVRVKDDGVGIPKDDLKKAVLPHTTSKVRELNDIFNLKSYGFRGEALASISSVSKFTIHSRYKDANVGYEYKVHEDKLVPKQRTIGTTVIVEDLFYNVPARRKFLKSSVTEYKHIEDTFLSLALANPKVNMLLQSDRHKQVNYDLKGVNTRMQRGLDIIGVAVDHVFKIEYELFGIKVQGVVVKPQFIRGKRRFLKVLVNNRIIEDRGVYRVIRDSLRPIFALDISPVGVLYIDMPISWVDFNVHPRKIEVRFSNPYRVFEAVQSAISSAIFSNKVSNSPTISLPKPSYQTEAFEHVKPILDSLTTARIDANKPDKVEDSSQITSINMPRLGLTDNYMDNHAASPILLEPFKHMDLVESENMMNYQAPVKVFQLMNRYIVAEYPDRVLLIDQHAAAERIRFEELGGEESGYEISQSLLVPVEIDSKGLGSIIPEILEDLKLVGFRIQVKEGKLILKAVPSYLEEYRALELLQLLLSRLVDIPKEEFSSISLEDLIPAEFKEIKRMLVATKACHTSIRANTPLTQQEMVDMVKRLFQCKVPYVCPHGRPIFVEFRQPDLDRFFWRDIK